MPSGNSGQPCVRPRASGHLDFGMCAGPPTGLCQRPGPRQDKILSVQALFTEGPHTEKSIWRCGGEGPD
jgi:hypothetical protein